jgi:quercetin dioxygenase-like cupin family protein
VEFPPDQAAGGFDRTAAFAAMGAGHAMDPDATRHPGMHKTDTVDYAIVLTGEIWALLDDDETLLRAGDTLVQRGTNHAWSNRGDRACLVAFILVSAGPLKGTSRAKPARRAAARAGRGKSARRPARAAGARSRKKTRRRSR